MPRGAGRASGERQDMTSSFAACSVVSKSHLAYARVLAESFRQYHPAARMFVLVVDGADGYVRPRHEPFELVELAELEIPDLPSLCFRYDAFELCCAAKAYLLRHLLRRSDLSIVCYLDSDILVLRELTELGAILDRHSIALTPHLIADMRDDGRTPGLRHILGSGAYNAGFIAVHNDPTAHRFLDWLGAQVQRYCVHDLGAGLFVDQRWLDLVPGMFDDVGILRHPGYNVGHWSLSHRTVTESGGEILVNGLPLHFFHFSGLDFDDTRGLSKHQDRFTLDAVPVLEPLFVHYRQRVLGAGHAETRRWPYGFARFSNGVPIARQIRRLHWSLGDHARPFGDPFQTEHPGSFWSWLGEDASPGSGISRFWYHTYLDRPDLKQAFPDVLGADAKAFLEWMRSCGRVEYGLPEDSTGRRPATPATASGGALTTGVSIPSLGANVTGDTSSEGLTADALAATVRALAASAISYSLLDLGGPDGA